MGAPKNTRHAEAFCLMHYACKCGHHEVIWNSRDGVTAFYVPCPSCGEVMGMAHVKWHRDIYAPHHRPHFGQRVWVGMSEQRAHDLAMRRVLNLKKTRGIDAVGELPDLTADIWRHGDAPDLRVQGHNFEHSEAA
ncbi:hypothetical protein SAMN05216321_101143 [Cupriavidus sp. OV038]|jgi:hypothetical protein|uniref:hypothetical protein n=1 Tax=unclassified Cupriavidus TaxID=2640874 RepID=UPI0008E3C0A9|nr:MULTISPECIES: hypothetical protein [unclassified Cupriavidus]SFB68937.1 hypothetical protein SAMN05216321_101143 [Cupriavidus sp. OV038]SFO58334.1 hypothetical protein SAMN05216322_101143 [Cupriavidus sp. OV096]